MVNDEKTKNSLMKKTKAELIDIILRKDDVEIRLKETLKTQDEDIDVLNNKVVGYEADINGLERTIEEHLNSIKELTQALNRKRKVIRRWQIAFTVLTILAIIVVAVIA